MTTIFDKVQFEEYVKSGAVSKVGAKSRAFKEVAESFQAVARRIWALASEIDADSDMLAVYVESQEISSLEELVETIEAKLEIFSDKEITTAINDLADKLNIKTTSKKASKADLTKALGL